MESYGLILRNAREAKNLDVETIARETSVSRTYLLAMENEKEDEFPEGPYITGFLRIYCEYLDVDAENVIRLYESKKLQETPVPVQLLERKAPRFIKPLVIVTSFAIVLGLAIWLLVGVFRIPQKINERNRKNNLSEENRTYRIGSEVTQVRLKKGDQILIPSSEGEDKNIVITVADTLGKLSLSTPVGLQILEFTDDRKIDLNGDGKLFFCIYLSDISRKKDYGAEVRMFMSAEDGSIIAPNTTEISAVETSTKADILRRTVIHESNRPYPFTVEVTFRGSCMFRRKVDSSSYEESYYHSSEQITERPNNAIRLWMSNSNAVNIRLTADTSRYDLEVGRAGEVKAEDIKWVHDSDGMYRIVVMELD
ncbi:helix-turn-helix domain-containing protein [Treponema sp.]|jgi:cytoskeletal protein RodZ|uniref:helix-turn-helix domain-containing protein n=1 Tax=Treponema sp. TaxID=166 RepID=UPI00257C9B77|nr:helix-turn-helix domain-containing protein [Treponema sp.]MBE6353765.1 helix-turn-helix domain-containing protein [Treponema sp.]